MLHLELRTGILSFAVFSRSSLDDTFPAEYVETNTALERFLAFAFPATNSYAFVQSFDLWCTSRANGKSIALYWNLLMYSSSYRSK